MLSHIWWGQERKGEMWKSQVEEACMCGCVSQFYCLFPVLRILQLTSAPELSPKRTRIHCSPSRGVAICSQSLSPVLNPWWTLPWAPKCTIFLNYLLWSEAAWENNYDLSSFYPTDPYLALCVSTVLGICPGVGMALTWLRGLQTRS